MGKKSKKHKSKSREMLKLLDDDITMDPAGDHKNSKHQHTSAKHYAKHQRRQIKLMLKQQQKRSRRPGGNTETAKANSYWHLVKVSSDSKLDRGFLVSSFGNYVDTPFVPLGFHYIDRAAAFYLEDNAPVADAIAGLDKRIMGPDNQKLKISVTPTACPDVVLNSDQMDILKGVMSRRYDATLSLLDLNQLHCDQELIDKNVLAPLSSAVVMKQALRIVREHIPSLRALSLAKNRLRGEHMRTLASLAPSCTHLAALNLEDNCLAKTDALKDIKMFTLNELMLTNNPLTQLFTSDPMAYIHMIRKILPRLQVLDKVNIDEYLATETTVPNFSNLNVSSGTIAIPIANKNETVTISEETAKRFVQEYYQLIDTPQRCQLVAAYAPQALLEIHSAIPALPSGTFQDSQIAQFLNACPATQHELATMALSFLSIDAAGAKVELSGKCHVTGTKAALSFRRIMTIVPLNGGLCCCHDVLEFT